MIEKRAFATLGRFRNEWLNANYHFSFSGYRDTKRVHWGSLRVWNDDEIAPKRGFSPHSHADMEIITYVREGAITHEDNLGNRGRTEAGDVQVMSAGSGVTHAEYNLEDHPTRLFQLWILPKTTGGEPYWGAAKFPKGDRAGQFVTLASGFAEEQAQGALPIRADARLLAATLQAGESTQYAISLDRFAYLVVARGAVTVSDSTGEIVTLEARDGAAIAAVSGLTVTAQAEAELILVDAPSLQ
jgi:redox-sensitive bicupin YhaK (pirin superfamily)